MRFQRILNSIGLKVSCMMLFVLMCTHVLMAQNIETDLKRLQQTYGDTLYEITFDFSIKYYERKNPAKPLEILKGFYRMQGSNRYSRIDQIETLETKRYLLNVSHDDSVLIIGPSKPETNTAFILTDSLLKHYSSQSKFISDSREENRSIRMYLTDSPAIDSLDMSYDSKSWFVKNILIYYGESYAVNPEDIPAPIVSINYFNYKRKEKGAATDFYNPSKYVSISGTKVTLKPRYKGYELINNLPLNQ